MIFAKTLTLTSANTGYTLTTLLGLNQSTLPVRFASVRIQADSADCFIVPASGSYANTAGVPNDYGYKITTTNEFQEYLAGANWITADELILGSGSAGSKIHVLVYTV